MEEAGQAAKKQLLGFDEINQLQEDTEASAYNAALASMANASAVEYENSVVSELGDTFVLTAEQIEMAREKADEFKQSLEDVRDI